ncbi:isopentenyl-diphosphate Delta-isomerase [Microbacterium sp. 1P10UB]|uniref:isopentenyl-diphosphate Delta-isomerase n=1 Tax=unclassified Microbacterium TaxID=2609290 RepID=UPI0039A1C932
MNVGDQVVLLDEEGRAIGTAPKATVHDTDTALHLAFSCHVMNDDGDVLVTRRALSKVAWPGVWTNSFCGHPAPGEAMEDAVRRRAAYELGLELDDVELRLPDFRYRAVDASGIVENEICPVFFARARHEPVPNPLEVVDVRWVDPLSLGSALSAAPWAFSPWLELQSEQLPLFGRDVLAGTGTP